MNVEAISEANRIILNAKEILILSHASPDPDTIGSALAMRFALLQRQKDSHIGCIDQVPEICNFLPGADNFVTGDALLELVRTAQHIDLIITVDTAKLYLLGEVYSQNVQWFEEKTIVNIDHHHLSNDKYGRLNLIWEYASNAEVLFDFFRCAKYEITTDIASCLMAGIITDTGRFSTPTVTRHTFQCAGQLLAKGVDLPYVSDQLAEKDDIATALFLGKILSRIHAENDGRIAWVALSQDLLSDQNGSQKLTSKVAAYLRSLESVVVGVAFLELPNGNIKVSMRAKRLDVRSVAAKFGGGGHIEAAGCVITGMNLDNAVASVISEIRQLKPQGVTVFDA